MKRAIIILIIVLAITIAINLVFVFMNRPSSPSTPISTPSPSSPIPTPDLTDINSIIADLERSSTPEITPVATFNIPVGFRFPENANLSNKTSLEIILPNLKPDPQTKRMDEIERELLQAHLGYNYYYDPISQNIVADSNYKVTTTIIDFGIFSPNKLEIKQTENVLWFNQNTSICQLRTDPKSPEHINQTIASQKSTTIKLSAPGIYIFYCQDNTENTQTIIVI